MAFKVRYLREDAIERDANDLLGEYGLARGVSITAPIPVEHLLEFHLGLSLDFDDLHDRLGIPLTGDEPDVLGALWVDSREVFNRPEPRSRGPAVAGGPLPVHARSRSGALATASRSAGCLGRSGLAVFTGACTHHRLSEEPCKRAYRVAG